MATVTTMVSLSVPDGAAEAALSAPDDSAAYPGVLLLMDALGLRPRLIEIAETIASWGYLVLAPNVFYRNGSAEDVRPGHDLDTEERRRAFFAHAMPRIASLTAPLAQADLAAYLTALTTQARVRTPVGVVGYCMGARLAMRAAVAHPDVVAACAGFHGGRLATDDQDSPHCGLPQARAEFLFGHADRDPSMNAAQVARLDQALADAGLVAATAVYPGARHGYTMSDTAVYDQGATERHFAELRGLLARTLSS